MESNSASDRDEEKQSKRGPTITSKANKGKAIITYTKRGVPVGEEATKLSTFEGLVARTMVPITYASWLDVGEETKEELWQYVSAHFVVDPKSRKQTLQSIGTKWRTFKHNLYKEYIQMQKDDPEENLLNPPAKYPFLKKADWKLFVAQRLSKKWQEKSKKAKKVRAHHKYNHRLSRKGYAGLLVEIMQQTGKTEEEIDRALLWKKARVLKTGGFKPDVQVIIDRIDELQKSSVEVTCGTQDVLTQALGTEEQRGHVRGMGKFITPHQYFYLPKTVKHYLDAEKKKVDQRFNKLEDELEKLKRGVHTASEAQSCQMWGDEDFEDEPPKESFDTSCYLAVDVASNIVAKGTIMMDTCENTEVMLEICVQGEALLPIPLEEEYIVKVKDAVGHILSWPRHLVIRCSDLEKVVEKPVEKPMKKLIKELQSKKQKKRPREPDEINEEKHGNEKQTRKEFESKKEKEWPGVPLEKNDKKNGKEKDTGKELEKVNEIGTPQRKVMGANRKIRIRIEKNVALMMTALMVDGQLLKVDSVKVQCEDGLFGYESYTYLAWDDFEAVFTLDELTGAVITSYMMYLYEQIKNGPKQDRGICFVSQTATSPSERKTKSKHIDDASRMVADRLFKRKDNDIILLPYNPGGHWVLAVLDMKTTTCYYLDSLRHSNVNLHLRQIIDTAMVLNAVQSRSNKRAKLKWVKARCPCQPGNTECGYYVLKFMKEIVEGGVEILVNDSVGGDKYEYNDADIDGIREEWASFAAAFIFQ